MAAGGWRAPEKSIRQMTKLDIPYETSGDTASRLHGTGSHASRRRPYVSLALIGDLIAVGEAMLIVFLAWGVKVAYLDVYLSAAKQTVSYIGLGAVLATIAMFAFRRLGLYTPERLLRPTIQLGRILLGLTGAFLVLVAMLYVLKEAEQFSRGWMLLWFAASFLALSAERTVVWMVLRSRAARDEFRQRVAIYGAGTLGKQVSEHLGALTPDVDVVGIFDDRNTAERGAVVPVAGSLEALIEIGKGNLCDQIIVAVPTSEARLREVIEAVSVLPIDVRLCPEMLHLPCKVYGVSTIGRLQFLDVQRRPMSETNLYLKAAMDYVLAGIGTLLCLPLLPVIALAIKLDSSGPVFFRQRRHGYNNRIIRVLKFRTMTVLEDGPTVKQASTGDARVTRVGRILRATNLDELPQLWNVLKGEMSLVGPRPHALAHNHFYGEIVDRYGSRLRVKPGITGWAQVNGFSGETADWELMRKRVEHDLYYIENWSFWLDLEIIFRTAVMMVTGRLVH